ncbi:MAG TPA: hypothetical protein PKA27_06985 [Fimbriimonadaceae bacterium]|nr:hypothetical protein [Fimbriimonadaceae bacterium]
MIDYPASVIQAADTLRKSNPVLFDLILDYVESLWKRAIDEASERHEVSMISPGFLEQISGLNPYAKGRHDAVILTARPGLQDLTDLDLIEDELAVRPEAFHEGPVAGFDEGFAYGRSEELRASLEGQSNTHQIPVPPPNEPETPPGQGALSNERQITFAIDEITPEQQQAFFVSFAVQGESLARAGEAAGVSFDLARRLLARHGMAVKAYRQCRPDLQKAFASRFGEMVALGLRPRAFLEFLERESANQAAPPVPLQEGAPGPEAVANAVMMLIDGLRTQMITESTGLSSQQVNTLADRYASEIVSMFQATADARSNYKATLLARLKEQTKEGNPII